MAERWEIISLQFTIDQAKTSYVNGELAKCPGYEPFDSFWRVIDGVETWTILLKRKVED